MEYIYSVKNGDITYSVFRTRKASGGKVLFTYGICAESSTVYVSDITTVEEIVMCMVRIISADRIQPQRIHSILGCLIS